MNAKHFILGALVLSAPALAQMQEDQPGSMQEGRRQMGQLTRIETDLLKETHKANVEEIRLGQLAERKSTNRSVQQFGRMMVTDHTQLDGQITQLASQFNLQFSEQEVTKAVSKKAEKLGKKSGVEFDREYMTYMVKAHDKLISLIERRQDQVKPEIQAALSQALPVLRRHHQEAQRILEDVKAGRPGVGGAGTEGYQEEMQQMQEEEVQEEREELEEEKQQQQQMP